MTLDSPILGEAAARANPAPHRRWDPIVKLTHWAIVLAILANGVLTEEGSQAHIWVGYALAAMLGLRLFWGLIGPAEARFTAFPPSPRRAVAHIRDIAAGEKREHRSHNPLGALMVYAIWSCLIVIIASGIAMAGLPGTTTAGAGVPAAGRPAAMSGEEHDDEGDEREGDARGEAGSEVAEELHEMAVNLLYMLILLHIAGVLFESRRSGRQLVLAMLPGRR